MEYSVPYSILYCSIVSSSATFYSFEMSWCFLLRRFVAHVCVNNETVPIATASGRTKKEAKRMAADNAVKVLMQLDAVSQVTSSYGTLTSYSVTVIT